MTRVPETVHHHNRQFRPVRQRDRRQNTGHGFVHRRRECHDRLPEQERRTAAARNSATSITYDRDGYYRVELNTTDTATAGLLEAFANATGALPVCVTWLT